jgi:PrcB C-terminal
MRSIRIILGICAAAILLGCLLFFFGPPSLQSEVNAALQPSSAPMTSSSGVVTYTVLQQGTNAISINDRTNYRIMTQSDFQSLWSLVYGNTGTPAIPTIDFSKYEVLAVFDGTHSTTGFSINVQGITEQNGVRTVMIDHVSPGAGCTPVSKVTSPFEIVEVPKTASSLAHIDTKTSQACSATQ